MRTFSFEEQEFITNMVKHADKHDSVFLANIIDDYLVNVSVVADFENDKVFYKYSADVSGKDDEIISFLIEHSRKMIIYFNLLRYLEKLHMVFVYQAVQKPTKEKSFGQFINNGDGKKVTKNIYDERLKEFIKDYIYKNIQITQPLKDFVKNDFQTSDDIKHNENLNQARKSLKTAWIAVWVTIFVSFIGTVLQISLAYKESNPITIDSAQFSIVERFMMKSQEKSFTITCDSLLTVDTAVHQTRVKR